PATITVTVTSIPEYCTTSASIVATESTSGLSTGAPTPSQTGAVTSVPNGSVPGNLTSVLSGATETQGTPSGGVPVVPIPTAGESVASPSATSNGSYISSSMASNLSSTVSTSSTAPASTTSEIASSTTSALPTSNNAASHLPGLFALAALLITFIVI
ncbi:MAG: hypothetical protein M1835_004639, partial [Candelina submexicana]